MTLTEWAETVLLKDNEFDSCFIATTEGEEGYDLEVEIDNGVIGSCFMGIATHREARTLAAELKTLLSSKGITVYGTRDEWEASWEEDDEDDD